MIIGLSGYATSGKDTVADILVKEFGYIKYAWADMVRLAAEALDPIVGVDDGHPIRYTDALNKYGYNEAKARFAEFRRVLQYIGTEVGRELIDDNVWVDATISRINREASITDRIVIADTRFPNEANKIKELSGEQSGGENLVVRVVREGVGPASDHISETGLDDFDFDVVLDNNGTLDDLRDKVYSLHEYIEEFCIRG